MHGQTSTKSDIRVSHELCGLKNLRMKDVARNIDGVSLTGRINGYENQRGVSI